MENKWQATQDDFQQINNFSKRSIAVFNPEMMGTKVVFTELTEDKGLHSHEHTQITYVVSGKFLFFIGNEIIKVKQGDVLLIESNVLHGCIPLELRAELFDVFNPMRQDFLDD